MKTVCMLLLCWLCGPALSAQAIRKTGSIAYTHEQVLHFDDFIRRFNAETGEERRAVLEQLFDEDDPRRSSSHPEFALYAHITREFTSDMIRENVRIPAAYPAEAIVAIAAKYRGRPDTLVAGLKKEYTPERASYWHVVSIKRPESVQESIANLCNTPEAVVDLPPNAHEVSFLPLLRGIIDYESLCPFTHCRECIDAGWQLTESALQKGTLVVENISRVTLFLNAGDRWRMEIREFNRGKGNAGWLIGNITPL